MKVISDSQKHSGFPKERKKTSLKHKLAIGGVFLILAGLVYVLFFAGLFDVRSVKISAGEKISVSDVEKIVGGWLDAEIFKISRRDNFYIFNPRKIVSILSAKILPASSIEILREGHDLNIKIEGRKAVGVWCFSKSGNCYFFDEEGVGFEKTGRTEGLIFTVVTDERDKKIDLGGKVESEETCGRFFKTKDILRRNGFEAKEFIIPEKSVDEFNVKTRTAAGAMEKDWLLMFSAQTDIESQIMAFVSLYDKKMTPEERDALEYADLRIPDRIYYK